MLRGYLKEEKNRATNFYNGKDTERELPKERNILRRR